MRNELVFTRSRGLIFWINLTYWCDMACSYCYATSVKNRHFMSEEVLGKIFYFLEELGVRRVILSGGEPTSHPDFLSIVKHCRRQDLKVRVNTHGLAFANQSFLKEAVDNGLSSINLSLKGVNEEDFYRNTGVDGFNQQKEAVRNILADERVDLVYNLTLNRYFMANFDKVGDLLQQWGATTRLLVAFARPIPGIDPFGGGQIPTEDEVLDFVNDYFSSLHTSELSHFFRLDIPLCRFVDRGMASCLEQVNFATNCFLRDGSALIFDPLGQVIPCNILTETVLGQIGKDFNTVKEYDRFLHRPDIKAKLKSLRVEDKPACETCSLVNRCCRGCAAFKIHNGQPRSLLVEAISGQ